MLKKREVDTGESSTNTINNETGSSSDDSENEILIEFEDETGEKKTITIIVQ